MALFPNSPKPCPTLVLVQVFHNGDFNADGPCDLIQSLAPLAGGEGLANIEIYEKSTLVRFRTAPAFFEFHECLVDSCCGLCHN